jgi:4-hydroxybenzoate polyprenyltransferase
MLLLIVGILIVLWIIGLLAHIAGAFIHLLLVIALIILLYHFIKNNRHPK